MHVIVLLRVRKNRLATARRLRLDYRLLGRLFVLQLMIGAAVRIVAWRTLRRLMPAFRMLCGGPLDAGREADFLRALDASSRRLPGTSTCLVRALVTEVLFDTRAAPVRVTIGVRRIDSRLESHAWAERQGRIIVGGIGSEDPRSLELPFVPLLVCPTTLK
jgi:hypothetical protein